MLQAAKIIGTGLAITGLNFLSSDLVHMIMFFFACFFFTVLFITIFKTIVYIDVKRLIFIIALITIIIHVLDVSMIVMHNSDIEMVDAPGSDTNMGEGSSSNDGNQTDSDDNNNVPNQPLNVVGVEPHITDYNNLQTSYLAAKASYMDIAEVTYDKMVNDIDWKESHKELEAAKEEMQNSIQEIAALERVTSDGQPVIYNSNNPTEPISDTYQKDYHEVVESVKEIFPYDVQSDSDED